MNNSKNKIYNNNLKLMMYKGSMMKYKNQNRFIKIIRFQKS